MRTLKRTAISMAAAQVALLCCGAAIAQTEPLPDDTTTATPAAVGAAQLNTVVVTGQRKALQTAQEIKRNAEEIVDSVTAEEAGKMPDKSITEVLQRVVGVTVVRQRSLNNDANHFSEEGSGIKVRGLGWGESNLNGREIFSAGWPGKDLSWGAVPAELMVGVDTYKNPSAERIEGAVGGLVDLRTGLPFDYNGTKGYASFGSSYAKSNASPSLSGLFTTQWDSEFGKLGVLVDVATNHSTSAQDSLTLNNNGPYYPRTDVVPGRTVWAPTGVNWGSSTGESDRTGLYGALQWKKNDMQSALTYFLSKSKDADQGSNFYSNMENVYQSKITNPVVDSRGVVVSGHYTYPGNNAVRDADGNITTAPTTSYGWGTNNFAGGGIGMGNSRYYNTNDTSTSELAWNFKWKINDRWAVQSDLQWVNSKFETNGREIQIGTYLPSIDISTNGNSPVQLGFDQATRDFLANPNNYYWNIIQPKMYQGESNLYAGKIDAAFKFDDAVLRDFRFGVRTTKRDSKREEASYATDGGGTGWKTLAASWDAVGASHSLVGPQNASSGNWGYIGASPNYTYPTELFNYSNLAGGRMGNLPSVVFPTFGFIKDLSNYKTLVNNVYYQRCVDKNTAGTNGSTCGFQPGSANYTAALNGTLTPNPTNDPAITKANADAKAMAEKYNFDTTLVYGVDPNRTSNAQLTTHALYGNLRFGFDDWKVPVDGNVGLRAVYTKVVSNGHISFDIAKDKYASTPPSVPVFAGFPKNTPLDVTDDHIDYMPSLNLKFNFTDKLASRLALARSIYRPDFKQLQENIGLEQKINSTSGEVTYQGGNSGNAKLRPLKADAIDLSLEWNPKSGQALTAVLFAKDVKDIIGDATYTRTYNSAAGTPQTFLITGPANVAKARMHGIELSADSYLDHFDFLKDKLPTWSKGLGVSANYSYIASEQTYYRDGGFKFCPGSELKNSANQIYGCDTNGLPYKDKLPMQGVAKNVANFALRYDTGGFSGRLAYNWNSRSLQGMDKGGAGCWDDGCHGGTSADPAQAGKTDTWYGVPVYEEAYGQWDASAGYTFNKKFSMSLSVSNLNNVVVRRTHEQAPGVMGVEWKFPGQSYYLSGRYEF